MGCLKSKSTEAVFPMTRAKPHLESHPKPLAEADNETKVIAERTPIQVGLEVGLTVHYCTCGRSHHQPYCDDSHKGTAFGPLGLVPRKSGKAFFCRCKASLNPPLCDGSHSRLKW